MSATILQALHAVMSEVGYVQKRDKNEFHKYRYAGEAALLEKLRPAMVAVSKGPPSVDKTI